MTHMQPYSMQDSPESQSSCQGRQVTIRRPPAPAPPCSSPSPQCARASCSTCEEGGGVIGSGVPACRTRPDRSYPDLIPLMRLIGHSSHPPPHPAPPHPAPLRPTAPPAPPSPSPIHARRLYHGGLLCPPAVRQGLRLRLPPGARARAAHQGGRENGDARGRTRFTSHGTESRHQLLSHGTESRHQLLSHDTSKPGAGSDRVY